VKTNLRNNKAFSVKPTSVSLKTYTGEKIRPVGVVSVELNNVKTAAHPTH